jgi:protocatechuate 3,4-dioxygenase beta subunit
VRSVVVVIVVAALIVAALLFVFLQGEPSPPGTPGTGGTPTGSTDHEPPDAEPPDSTGHDEVEPGGTSSQTGPGEEPAPGEEPDDSTRGTISGTVTLSDGSPARRAHVIAVGYAGRGSKHTDDAGKFTVARLRPGKYTVSASLEGYARARKIDIVVLESRDTGGTDLVLLQGGVLEGKVVDETGEAVPCEICISQIVEQGSVGEAYRANTDKDGSFRLAAIVPGTYRMEVYTREHLQPEAQTIEIYDCQTRRLEVTVRKGGWISGTVLDERRDPVGEAIVQASSMRQGASAPTDAKGEFRITGLADGEYTVTARHKDYPRSEPVAVTVVAGQGVEGVQVTLKAHPQGTIAGKVVSEGKPVQDAVVQIRSEGFADWKTTNHEGKFSFHGVEKAVDITVKATGCSERKLSEVQPGKADLVIEIERTGFPVTGEVVLDKSVPVPYVTISTYRIDASTGKEHSKWSWGIPTRRAFPTVSFNIPLVEGSYRLVFSAQGYESEERSITITNAPEEISDVTLKPKR